jgi:hypothetical protein
VLHVDHLFAHPVLAGSDDCNVLINHLGMIVEDIFMEALDFSFPGMCATIFFLPLTVLRGCIIDFLKPLNRPCCVSFSAL